ncbi:hypothetical protein OAK09_01995 [Candidatus Marinimicrobia bacterium]|nr:hypothetical protein [Candidatus Neomarinimicrobiota bacterium]
MNNRGLDRRYVERRNGRERREKGMPVENDHRSGKDRREGDRRILIDRRNS